LDRVGSFSANEHLYKDIVSPRKLASQYLKTHFGFSTHSVPSTLIHSFNMRFAIILGFAALALALPQRGGDRGRGMLGPFYS
jgi:hypothetical protein